MRTEPRDYIFFKKYFEEYNPVDRQIRSFNYFADVEMTEVVREVGKIEPKILPPGVREFTLEFKRAWLEKASYAEKEGIIRTIYPFEARLRNITYSGPVYLEFLAYENGDLKDKYSVMIGRLPIMVKSKYCNLYGLSEEELISVGEDPNDPGGYFIVNGSERVLVISEELATNKFYVQKGSGPVKYTGFLFSESKSVGVPHKLELLKDGILYLSFGKIKRIPLIPVIKALGLTTDYDIAKLINEDQEFEETYINLYEFVDIQDQESAILWIANRLRFTGSDEVKMEKVNMIFDNYLLPHLGQDRATRPQKAINLLKMARKLLMLAHEMIDEDIKDHLMHKHIRLAGDLMRDLFRVVFKMIVNDALYQYQRMVKRGRVPDIRTVFRAKIFTERFESAMGTGQWTRNRSGVSQLLDRTNRLSVYSHLTRVWSSIRSEAEMLEARMVHGTHWGRLDFIETPEGKNTGLRKNLTLLSRVSYEEANKDALLKELIKLGLKPIQ